VKACRECTLFINKPTKDLLHPIAASNKVWDNINIDLFGPMPNSKHILVATDNTSRYPTAKVVPSTSAQPVIQALDNIYTDYGTPSIHRTYNGPPFNSEGFSKFSHNTGITHIKTYPYHPQANPAETFM
jgi:hypothetical protein